MANEVVLRAVASDPKLARLTKHLPGIDMSEPSVVVRCSCKGKLAVIAVTDQKLALIAQGLVGLTAVAHIRGCIVDLQSDSRGLLRVAGQAFVVDFTSVTDGPLVAQSIDGFRQRLERTGSGSVQLAEHERIVRSCTYLGGAYMSLPPRVSVDLIFRETSLQIFAKPASATAVPLVQLQFNETFELDITGPGRVTTGGGFFGGGSGLVGAAEGIAIAGLLNAVTTKTSITTVIVVRDEQHEAFFVNSATTPDDLRRQLSPVFVRVGQNQRSTSGIKSSEIADDLVSKLERLAALRTSGLLTDEEFTLAKTALIAGR